MLSKPATMLLGFIYEKPLNAYEIIKPLNYMNVKWWFNIADSTVYSTLKTLEKKEFISGTSEKVGNMPDRTVYTLSDTRKKRICKNFKSIHPAIQLRYKHLFYCRLFSKYIYT